MKPSLVQLMPAMLQIINFVPLFYLSLYFHPQESDSGDRVMDTVIGVSTWKTIGNSFANQFSDFANQFSDFAQSPKMNDDTNTREKENTDLGHYYKACIWPFLSWSQTKSFKKIWLLKWESSMISTIKYMNNLLHLKHQT